MKYVVKENFKTKINKEIVRFSVNEIIELEDEKIIAECTSKGLIRKATTNDLEEETTDEFLTEKQLKKMKKADLVGYGQSIGLDELNESFTCEELVQMILEYIENLEME